MANKGAGLFGGGAGSPVRERSRMEINRLLGNHSQQARFNRASSHLHSLYSPAQTSCRGLASSNRKCVPKFNISQPSTKLEGLGLAQRPPAPLPRESRSCDVLGGGTKTQTGLGAPLPRSTFTIQMHLARDLTVLHRLTTAHEGGSAGSQPLQPS